MTQLEIKAERYRLACKTLDEAKARHNKANSERDRTLAEERDAEAAVDEARRDLLGIAWSGEA